MVGSVQWERRQPSRPESGAFHGGIAAQPSPICEMVGKQAVSHAALLCSRMPRAVICLTSAAYLSGLLDDEPGATWIAIPAPSHGARLEQVPHRLLRWSFPGAFETGLAKMSVDGVVVNCTGPARTVVDLIRYARHVRLRHAGVLAGRRLASLGGDLRELVEIARRTNAPAETLRTVEILVHALR